MSVSLLLVTHKGIGEALVTTVRQIMGDDLAARIATIEVAPEADLAALDRDARRLISGRADDGVLVLTDMYGSSPSNLATPLATLPGVSVVTGINLPMLVRALNYLDLPLSELVDKTVEGGLRSIFIAAPRSA